MGLERRGKQYGKSIGALRANRRSLRQAQGRLFDCASRDETARVSARDDNFYVNQSLKLELYVDTSWCPEPVISDIIATRRMSADPHKQQITIRLRSEGVTFLSLLGKVVGTASKIQGFFASLRMTNKKVTGSQGRLSTPLRSGRDDKLSQ